MRARPVTAFALTRYAHAQPVPRSPAGDPHLAWAHENGLVGRERINRSDEAGDFTGLTRRALGRWRARRGTAVAHSARCAWLLLEERCARFRVGVAEAAHEPAHCATVGCEGIREVRHAVKSVAVSGARAAARARPLGRVRASFMSVRVSSVCVLPRSVERHCLSSAVPPRDSRADRREASSLTLSHVGRLMGQKHRSPIEASRRCRSAHRGSWVARPSSSQRTWFSRSV